MSATIISTGISMDVPMDVPMEVIDTLHAISSGFFRVIGTGLLHGTLLAVITACLAATVLRRAQPALITALWTIVLVKFLVPVGPSMPLSLSGLIGSLFSSDSAGAVVIGPGAVAAETAVVTRSAGELAWVLVQIALMLGYLAIVARLLVARVAAQRAHRRWTLALPAAGPELVAAAARAAAAVGLGRLPLLRVSDQIAAPEITGLFAPIVVLPAGLSASPAALEAALIHELAHLRRRDTWLRAVQLLAGALLFFWPVVGWVNRRIDEHREMACDQWAVSCGRLSPREYARTLVVLARRAQVQSMAAGGVLGLALVRGRTQLEARVAALLAAHDRPRIGRARAAVLAMWALVCLGGAGKASAAAGAGDDQCLIEPGVIEYIMATFPEADTDGDGALSREEVCAQTRRLRAMSSAGAQVSVDAAAADNEDAHAAQALVAYMDRSALDCVACSCVEDPLAPTAPMDKRMCTTDSAEP